MRFRALLVWLIAAVGSCAWAQATSPFAVSAQPIVSVPIGPALPSGVPFYTIGGGVGLRAEYTPPGLQLLLGGVGLDAEFLPLNGAGKAATFLSFGPVVGVQYFPVQRFGIRLGATGGIYAGMIEAGTILDPFAGALLDFSYQVKPALAVALGGSFKYHFTPTGPAYYGVSIGIGTRYYLGGNRADLRIDPEFDSVFPVFYGYYNDHPVGTVTLRNQSMGPLQDVQISLLVKEYMSAAKPAPVVPVVQRGKDVPVAVNALFNDSVLGVTEQKKVAGELEVSYTYFGQEMKRSYPVNLIIQPRNGMTWDLTQKAASFVTTGDDRVRNFAAPFAADARDRGQLAVSWRFRVAMALFEALRIHGLGYIADQATPYLEKSMEKTAIDLLRFPVETLVARVGDCDDLSILYAALLESSGIQAAFLTTPGHIFVAFNLGMDHRTAQATFASPDDLLLQADGSVWLPVEVTRVRDGFLRAWKEGAQEWRAAGAAGGTEFVPLLAAWKQFPAVDTGRVLQGAVVNPEPARVFQAYSTALSQFYRSDFEPRIIGIQAALKKAPDDPKLLNRLGVLYARFGMNREARMQFEQIVRSSKESFPAVLINLGNLAYLEGSYQEAYDFYSRALDKTPDSPLALLGVARAAYELGMKDAVKDAYDRLYKAAPQIAKEYPYLAAVSGGAPRAASAEKEVSEWTE
jgi:tetratricopeptide (TPR) repeat protein